MVYGDVNSTVAAALVAAKLHIPVAHVEAGLRSFDLTMPEEVNRRLTDQLSDLLFVTSLGDAVGHLRQRGARPSTAIHFVGNPMIDTLLANLDRFDADAAREPAACRAAYAVATLHRPANVDTDDAATAWSCRPARRRRPARPGAAAAPARPRALERRRSARPPAPARRGAAGLRRVHGPRARRRRSSSPTPAACRRRRRSWASPA